MKVILTYGSFDLFHVGHVRLLRRLRGLGDRLIVGVSTDEFNSLKNKKSFFSFPERMEIVAACKYVDEVFAEACWDQKRSDIDHYDAKIVAMGSDWKGRFDHLSKYCEVIYLDRTEGVSTTEIKKNLASVNSNELDELESSLHSVIEIVRVLSGKA